MRCKKGPCVIAKYDETRARLPPGRTFLRTSPAGRDYGSQMRPSNPIHIDGGLLGAFSTVGGSQMFIH